MKKFVSLFCAGALILSLAACSAETSNTTDYSGQTVTGQVTAMEGSSVTLQLGEWTEPSSPPDQNSAHGADSGETPPEKPSDSGSDSSDNSNSQTPPTPPDGNTSDSENSPEQPPEKPSDAPSNSSNTPPTGSSDGKMPGGMTSFTAGEETAVFDLSSAEITKNHDSISLDDIAVDDILTVSVGDANTVTSVEVVSPGSPAGFGGSEFTQGSSANTISTDGTYSDTTYTSSGDDENALRVDGATATLENITVEKSGGATSNTENGDFYGVNAALLATNGATVTIKHASITSSAQNGNGVFSYGSGTTVNISDSSITTSADNSGGIQTTGGGTTNATDLTVTTSGNSSAAIRSDRGGGTVNVSGGTYTSNGYNSPAVYSTADITVKNAELTANNSEALVIEGQNSITLENCTVSGNMSDTNGASSDENVHNVMIYQSMSGDAEVGLSTFSMTGGSLTGKNGDLFYITNTRCQLTLSNVQLQNEDPDGYLLRVVGNSASHGWGSAGSNGAQVEFTADDQKLTGNIVVDTISTLSMTLTNGSIFTGTVNITENTDDGTAVSDNAVVTIESGCTWNLTGNCTLTSLTNNGTINFNGYSITLSDGTVLK